MTRRFPATGPLRWAEIVGGVGIGLIGVACLWSLWR
jgi:hypothetical protein